MADKESIINKIKELNKRSKELFEERILNYKITHAIKKETDKLRYELCKINNFQPGDIVNWHGNTAILSIPPYTTSGWLYDGLWEMPAEEVVIINDA